MNRLDFDCWLQSERTEVSKRVISSIYFNIIGMKYRYIIIDRIRDTMSEQYSPLWSLFREEMLPNAYNVLSYKNVDLC